MGRIKVILFLSLTFILFSVLFSGNVFSQETTPEPENTSSRDFDQSYQEYLQKIDEYQKSHEEYVIKRASYLRFKTLKSQEEAQAATLVMLQRRDEVVMKYLAVLIARINEATGVTQSIREALTFRLESEIDWFEEHREVMTSAGSLEDLIADSNDAKARLASLDPLIYETLAQVSMGRLTDFQERINDIFTASKDKVEEIRKEERDEYKLSDRKLQIIDRWLFESGNRIIRGEEKQSAAEDQIASFGKLGPLNAVSEYNMAQSQIGEAQLFYKESSSFLKEVIREIKIAED